MEPDTGDETRDLAGAAFWRARDAYDVAEREGTVPSETMAALRDTVEAMHEVARRLGYPVVGMASISGRPYREYRTALLRAMGAERARKEQASLGLATTQELLLELVARADVAAVAGEMWPFYRTVDRKGEARAAG